MYNGKEVCQGCGKTGEAYPRYKKDRLCHECEQELKLGQSTKLENSIKYYTIFQHYFAYYAKEVNVFVHKVLASLDNQSAPRGELKSLKQAFGSNGKYYRIDTRLFIPLQELFEFMDSRDRELKKELESIPNLVDEAISLEKDRIYNEGIAKCRDLLTLLNEGKVSTASIENNYSYYTKNEKTKN